MRSFTKTTGISELYQKNMVLTMQFKFMATTGYVYKVEVTNFKDMFK